MTRGTIRNKKQRLQIIDMSKLRYGNMTPTDLDAMIEYKNAGFVLIEVKFNSEFYTLKGQKLAHERMVDALWIAKKPAVLLFASHNTPLNSEVKLDTCTVKWFRYTGRWRKGNNATVKQMVDSFIEHLDKLIEARQSMN